MRRILVATDFSTRSDRALRRAVLIAGQHEAALTLIHVVDDDQPADLVEPQVASASELLRQTARTITDVDNVPADAVVATGDAFAGILRASEEIEPDLIIVGSHRRQFLDTFVGTTAERTIRRSPRPVLMANGVPSAHYNRALLAVDFDGPSRAAVETASRFGILERTEVLALHVFDAPALGMMKRSLQAPEAIDHYVGSEEARTRAELGTFLAEAGLRASRQILMPRQGSPAGAILSCAEKQDADLIVVGTNRRKGIKRFLLGSVAQEVLLDTERDVLVVPAAEEADKPTGGEG